MNKIIVFAFLFAITFSFSASAQEGLSATDFEKRISIQQTQLLDVRTAREYQSGHLKNSSQADWQNKEQFADRIKYLDKSKPLLVYCASGVRSAAAAKWLLDNGFTNVQNLKGGIIAWKLEGKPVEAATAIAQLSLDQYNAFSKSDKIVLVDFGAEWCPPCQKMKPVLEQLQTDLSGKFKLVKVDGGNDIDVMKAQNITSIPAYIIYKNGKEVWRKTGVTELAELKANLK